MGLNVRRHRVDTDGGDRLKRATIISLACLIPMGSLLCPALPGDAVPVVAASVGSTVIAASCQVNGCSGTAIEWNGAVYIVTADHCFRVGQTVTFTTGDKTRGGSGKVIATDDALDLALVEIDRADVTSVVTVPAELPAGQWVGVGYPKGKGPTEWRGRFIGSETITNLPRPRWAYKITSGKFKNGNSGSGVFRGGCLVAVATHMNDGDRVIYAAPLHDLRSFLVRAGKEQPQLRLAKEGTAREQQPAGEDPRSWGDRDRTREILEIKARLKQLTAGSGDPGPPGPSGPPGPGMDPATLAQILQRLDSLEDWTENFRAVVRVRVHPNKE